MATHAPTGTRIGKDYFDLVKRFPLLPIRSEGHLTRAFKLIDELSIIDEDKLTTGQAAYLAVLSGLVAQYEDEHHALPEAFKDGVDALRYLVQQSGMTASDLGRLLGNRQLGAAILRRQRQLSKAHLVRLAEHFRVSTDLFLKRRPHPMRKAS